MAANWLAIKVELLGGRGDELWPPPGRLLAVGPRHTFAQLAEAIDAAFARWDRSHLCAFTLADGRTVTDPDTSEEMGDSPFGAMPVQTPALDEAVVAQLVEVGDGFRYVFDFGDDWTHACTVTERVDPREVLGISPKRPTAYFGWGTIPDQYGRRWADDTGEGPLPRRPARPHPMLTFGWPGERAAPALDVAELRGAVARGDVPAIVAAVEGRDIGDALQQVGSAWLLVLEAGHDRAETVAVSLVNRLNLRRAAGDAVLSEDLIARLRGTSIAARHLPVDLLDLASELDGSEEQEPGTLDLRTGEVLPGFLTDPAMVGEDAYVDFDEEPDRWLEIDRPGSRDAWRDMADFAAGVTNAALRERLERAIEGRGAFRRFRDLVHDEGLGDAWHRFSDDRAMGRARQFLADEGIRATPT